MTNDKSWHDPDLDREINRTVDRYSAKMDQKDIIRIVSAHKPYYVHILPAPKFYGGCGKPGQCILCDREYDRVAKVGCLIVHLATKTKGGKDPYRPVGIIKTWLFGGDKWRIIQEIIADNPKVEQDGITKFDLIITCLDQKKQKLLISLRNEKSLLTKDMLDKYKVGMEKLLFYTGPSNIKSQKHALGEDNDDDRGNEPENESVQTSEPSSKPKPPVPDPDAPGDAQEDPHQDLLPDADANATRTEVDDLLSDLDGDEGNPL